ncbi:MAG TPA: hypothetical protein VN231_09900 [Allosphingosinicella sp.]|nr:hypothetical protein [Allosphingosinicella sp.]
MRKRATCLIGAALLVSGCVSYPPLASFGANEPATLEKVLEVAGNLQADYASGYETAALEQDLSQLPIIAAAAAAAWILLDNGANAVRDVGRIGIGASAYSAARGQLLAADLPDAYIAGHGALTCVLAEGPYFSGQGALNRRASLRAQLDRLARAIDETVAAAGFQPLNPSTTEAELLRTARATAEQAIGSARTVEATALGEDSAFDGALPVFRHAVSSISVRVASRGRVRPPVDYATLRAGFSPQPAAGTEDAADDAGGLPLPPPPPPPPTTALEVIQRLNQATANLVGETARLRAATPPFAQRLTAVAACPDLVR